MLQYNDHMLWHSFQNKCEVVSWFNAPFSYKVSRIFSNFLPNAFCTDSELIVSELSIIEILSTADDDYESLKCLTHLS